MSKRYSRMVLGATLLASGAAFGQANVKQDVMFVSGPVESCALGTTFDREVRRGPDGRPQQVAPVSTAPYSAVGTTKVIRTLSDGNRIVRTNTMRYARDSQGRTRTEYSLDALGPFALEETRTVVTIEDPVAGHRFVLHPEQRRAEVFDTSAMPQGFTRGELRSYAVGGANTVVSSGSFGASAGTAVSAPALSGPMGVPDPARVAGARVIGSPFMVMSSPMPVPMAGCGPQDPRGGKSQTTVNLGERMMEGVKAVGSRREFEIAAGSIGNEQAIVIRTEQWFSPELGVVIESTHQDPMSGDTSYKLTQIRRGDPEGSLFAVPAGYATEQVPTLRFESIGPRSAPAENEAPAGNDGGN